MEWQNDLVIILQCVRKNKLIIVSNLSIIHLVCMFKNWKLLYKNIFENTCEWKNMLKCIKCCLNIKNGCLKIQTKHPKASKICFVKILSKNAYFILFLKYKSFNYVISSSLNILFQILGDKEIM